MWTLKTNTSDTPLFVSLTREGLIVYLLANISLITGFLFNFIFLILPAAVLLGVYLWFFLYLLLYPVPDAVIEVTIPSSQIKAKQFMAVNLEIRSKQHLQVFVRLEVSEGLFPVIVPLSSIIDTHASSGSTFVLYGPKRSHQSVDRLVLQFRGMPGLLSVERRIPIEAEILVLPEPQRISLPWTMKQKIMEMLISEVTTTVKGRGSEFLTLRDFVYGDEIRHIHWRATAKHGKLITKEFEEPRMLRFVVIVDKSLFMTGNKLEFALSAVIEMATVFNRSNHSLTVIVHGQHTTQQFRLGSSVSALTTLAINLLSIRPEGTRFDYGTLANYLQQHKLTGAVGIMLTDTEQEPKAVQQGMSLVNPLLQRVLFFSLSTPGFGTLALTKVRETRMISVDQVNYRRLIIEPELDLLYSTRNALYEKYLTTGQTLFHLIDGYNTNIMLELRDLLSRMGRSKQVRMIAGGVLH